MFLGSQAQEVPAYRNPKLPVEQRLADLLSRMKLEEKVAQLQGVWENQQFMKTPESRFVDDKGAFLPDHAALLLKDGIGEMSRPSEGRGPREMAEFTNTMQKWIKENTRLGIPVLFHDECLHGHVAQKALRHPAAIGIASTWDGPWCAKFSRRLLRKLALRGAQECLAPVLDLARDPRWGRTEETYGEDPYLVSRIGVAAISGFQGVGPFIDKAHVLATAKHFAVHGQPEGAPIAPTAIL
jgi:beta-glucosidase